MTDFGEAAASRLRTACELADAGIALRLARFRRESPGSTDAELRARLVAWLLERPGADQGDGDGRPRAWPT